MSTKRKSFDDWTTQSVRDTFGLSEVEQLPLLDGWLSFVTTPNAVAAQILEEKRLLLRRFFRTWNEDELKFRFIAQVVELTSLIGERYNTFMQRNLSVVVNDIQLHGRPELMVATGQEDPKKPYFFIHEYKPSKRADEPLGQVLAAMVAAQALNQDGLPIFGCFVIGAIWQFLVLDNQHYALSRIYDATDRPDLQAIFSALCQSKAYIEVRSADK